LLALQVLLALAAQPAGRGRPAAVLLDSPRRTLLRLRGGMAALLRTLGPRQFQEYRRMLEIVHGEARQRASPKVRQAWPRRRPHKPPKPPKIRIMSDVLKRKLAKHLLAA
jgi:hypothetical protein